MTEGMELARVEIVKTLTDDDVVVEVNAYAPDGDGIALIDALGMIELGKDTLIRRSMGEDDL